MLSGFPNTWGDFTFEVEATSGDETVTRTYTWRVTTRMWIVYQSDDREPGVVEGFAVNVGAGEPYERVSLGKVDYVDWLDANTIRYTTSGNDEAATYSVDASGTKLGKPTLVWRGPATCSYGPWSPDNRTLAVRCPWSLTFISRGDLTHAHTVAIDQELPDLRWSPDSSRVWIGAVDDEHRLYHAVVRADATAPVKLVPANLDLARRYVWTEWSPDSTRLVLRAEDVANGPFDIYAVNPADDASLRRPALLSAPRGDATAIDVAGFLEDGRLLFYRTTATAMVVLSADLSGDLPVVDSFRTYPGWSTNSLVEAQLLDRRALVITRTDSEPGDSLPSYWHVIEYFSGPTGSTSAYTTGNGWKYTPDLSRTLSVQRSSSGLRLDFGKDYSWSVYTLSETAKDITFPIYQFSPDATRAFFAQKRANETVSFPYYSDLRGGSVLGVQLEREGELVTYSASFSPDSSRLTYMMKKPGGATDFQMVDVSGSVPTEPRKLNGEGRVQGDANWQPAQP